GRAQLLQPRAAGPDNPTAQNLVLVQWEAQPPAFDLVAVNLASQRSQCYASLDAANLSAWTWAMRALLSQERYERPGVDLERRGFYLDLPCHEAQLFHFSPSEF